MTVTERQPKRLLAVHKTPLACLLLAAITLFSAAPANRADADNNNENQRKVAEWTALLRSPDAEKRVSAATSLLHLDAPAAAQSLAESLRTGGADTVISVLKAVAIRGDERFLSEALALLGHESQRVREAARETLAAMRGPEAIRRVVAFAQDADAPLPGRVYACAVLAERQALDAVEPLVALLDAEEPLLAQAAYEALRRITRMDLAPASQEWAAWWEGQRHKSRAEMLEDLIGRQARRIGELESRVERLLIERFALQPNQNEGVLAEALKSEFPGVRQYAVRAVAQAKIAALGGELAALLQDPVPAVRAEAAAGLAALGAQDAIPALLPALHDPFDRVRNAAARALGDLRAKPAIGDLVQALDAPAVARAAAEALGRIGDAEAVPGLAALVVARDRNAETRSAAATALGRLGDRQAADALIRTLDDPDVRWFAIDALGAIGAAHQNERLREAARPVARHLLEDPKPDVREAAAVALGKIGERESLGPLAKALGDAEARVARQAALAFERIANDSKEAYAQFIGEAKEAEAYSRAARLNAMAAERFRADRQAAAAFRRDHAACLRLAQRWGDAKAAYQALLRDTPDDPALYAEMASVLEAMDGESAALLDLYAAARAALPDRAPEYWAGSLAVLRRLQERGRFGEVAAAVAAMEQKQPGPGDGEVAEQLRGLGQAAREALAQEDDPERVSERVERLLGVLARHPAQRGAYVAVFVQAIGERAVAPLVKHGLAHAEEAAQLSAIEALEKITGRAFGLPEDHAAEARQEAIQKWKAQWEQERDGAPAPE